MSNRTFSPLTKALIKAKNLIENPGHWVKGASWTKNPKTGITQFCTMGAIHIASNNLIEAVKVKRYFGQTIFSDYVDDIYNLGRIADWNDSDKVTHKDVIEAFDRAIQRSMENV